MSSHMIVVSHHSRRIGAALHGFFAIRRGSAARDADNPSSKVAADGLVYRFAPFELDSSRRVATRGGEVVSLPDQCSTC